MVPAWVLLRREIRPEHDASAFGGASAGGAGEESMGGTSAGGAGEESMGCLSEGGAGEESMGGASAGGLGKKSIGGASAGGSGKNSIGGASAGGSGKNSMGGASAGGSGKDSKGWGARGSLYTTDAILDYLRSLKPDARFANPPELSALRLLRPTESIPPMCRAIRSAFIASADKDLVALYAGPYRPGSPAKGGYLVYDASKNSLSTIPLPPYDYYRTELGQGAVVVAEEDTYRLCELTRIKNSNPPQAALCTWRPSSPEWKVETGSFPPELSQPDCFFWADMCFSYRGSILCWVNLFNGMVICDLALQTDGRPEFCFIPLPRECATYDRYADRSSRSFELPQWPEEFRSIACVGGCIKFVSMEGFGQRPGSELFLSIWTLSTNLCDWNKCNEYRVSDIWASEAYLALGLPNIPPSFPVLSMHEDDVVCLIVTHWNRALDGEVEYRGQHLLCVDMQHNKVSQSPTNTGQLHSQLFATDCSSYLQCLEDHQGKFKTRKVGASGKRVVL